MKRRLIAAVAALMLTPGAALADPVDGLWRTAAEDGRYAHVRFGACGDRICGTIAATFDGEGEYQSDTVGRKLVRDLRPEGGGAYSGGQIWQPSTGRTYAAKMQLSGDSLTVSGCVGPVCKTATWTRVR